MLWRLVLSYPRDNPVSSTRLGVCNADADGAIGAITRSCGAGVTLGGRICNLTGPKSTQFLRSPWGSGSSRPLAVSLNRLNEIVLGKRAITADIALRLAPLFDMSPQFWMRL